MIRNYWLVAIRKLLRHKAHSIINILGLTIGIASCFIIFLLTRYELSYDTFHPGKDRIYRVVAIRSNHLDDTRKLGHLPCSVPPTLQTELTGCEAISGFYLFNAQVTIPGREPRHFDAPERGATPDIVVAQPDYFRIFHYQWLAGNPNTSLNEPFRVVLTSEQLHKYFGDIKPEAAIGRQIIYRDSLNVFVSGIVAAWDHNTDFAFNDFISYATIHNSFLKDYFPIDQWGNWAGASQGFV